MRDIHTGNSKLEHADDGQRNFTNELKNINKRPKSVKKVFYKQH